uniref:Putative terminase n=1 Tax=viral metagenome TaxID=1070528 RepID=A0A6M3J1C3_9ZZZZ
MRNTYGDLEATSLKTWLEWFDTLGIVKRRLAPRLNYTHTFNDGKGPIELELMFIALDRPDDVRKLKSLELTGVYLNELSEIPQAALVHFKSRVNRFPAERDCNENYWSGIIADTNPPETDHWIYRIFEQDKPEGHRIFHQPPALIKTDTGYIVNDEADNLEHLKGGGDYYLQMIQGQTEEFIRVYCMGQYGTVVDGKRVYPQYNDDFHSIEEIEVNEFEPILLAWDYGTVSPACLVVQQVESRILAIKEFTCEYMTVKELAEQAVIPWLNRYARGMPMEVTADPADTYDGNAQLEELGLIVEAASTNRIGARIAAVADNLNLLVQGKPKLCISRQGCPKLRQGFLGKYNYRRLRVIGEEKYQDVPNKTHPFSDCFAAKTKILMWDFLQKNIENVKPGDYVMTPNGACKVTHAWLARKDALVYEYAFSNGSKFIATPDHRVFTNNGWVRLCDLTDMDILHSIGNKIGAKWLKRLLRLSVKLVAKSLKLLNGVLTKVKASIARVHAIMLEEEEKKELKLMGYGLALTMENTMSINHQAAQRLNCIDTFGKSIMEQFQKGPVFTTKTLIDITMPSTTLNSWMYRSTQQCMGKKTMLIFQKDYHAYIKLPLKPPKCGTLLTKVDSGTQSIAKKYGLKDKNKNLSVLSAELNTSHISCVKAFVRQHVKALLDVKTVLITKCVNVLSAAKTLLLTNTQKLKPVEITLVGKRLYPKLADVYDLTVENEHCFYANGICTHNCHDSLQYACLYYRVDLGEDNDYPTYSEYDEETRNKVSGY